MLMPSIFGEDLFDDWMRLPVERENHRGYRAAELMKTDIKDCQVKVVLTDETEYCFSQTLDELTECLNPSLFFRANRQYLISREAIKDIDLWFNSRLSINLYYSGIKEKILVSKARVAEFKEWFSKRKR